MNRAKTRKFRVENIKIKRYVFIKEIYRKDMDQRPGQNFYTRIKKKILWNEGVV